MTNLKHEVKLTEKIDHLDKQNLQVKASIKQLLENAENILKEFDKEKYAYFIEYLKSEERKKASNFEDDLILLLKILQLNQGLKSLIFLIDIHHVNLESFESKSKIFQENGPSLASVLQDICKEICDENNGIDLNVIKKMLNLEINLKIILITLGIIGGGALLTTVLMAPSLFVANIMFFAGTILILGCPFYGVKLVTKLDKTLEQIEKCFDEIQTENNDNCLSLKLSL